MEPKIIRQKKVLIKQDEQYFKGNSRLSLSSVSAVPVVSYCNKIKKKKKLLLFLALGLIYVILG